MKNIRKIGVSLLVLVMVLALAGCGGKAPDELAGTWKLSGGEAMGQTISMEQLAEFGMDMDITLTFESAKKVKAVTKMGGTETTEDVDYTFENGTVSMQMQGASSKLTLEDGVLKWDVGTAVLLFEKQ